MIIDTPLIPDLARGTGRVIPQEGDAQVHLPPMIMPVVECCFPHQFAVLNSTTIRTSATANFQLTRTNLGITSAIIMVVPPGIYDIYVHVTMRTNYTLIPSATPDFRVHFIEGGLSRFDMLLLFATVGANQCVFAQNRLLVIGSGIVEWFVNANGVGQSLDVNGSVNLVRVL